LAWATHRLGGIQSPANAAYSTAELEYQLKNSGAKALFTCVPLLDTARQAAKNCGIPENRIYILEVPESFAGKKTPKGLKTVDDLIREGEKLDRLPKLDWEKGDGALRTAFLCYSSGTSGLPVRIECIARTRMYILTYCTERCHDIAQERHRQHQ